MQRCSLKLLQKFTPILLPSLTPSMDVGRIIEWKVQVGDQIGEGTLWCTIGTDKATKDFTEVMRDGYVAKLYGEVGKEYPVQTPIALLVDEKEHIPLADTYKLPTVAITTPPAASSTTAPGQTPAAATVVTQKPSTVFGGSVDAALKSSGPAVALLASQIDRKALETIAPTGKGGRFTKADLLASGGPLKPKASSVPEGNNDKKVEQQSSFVNEGASSAIIRATAVVDFTVSDSKLIAKLCGAKKKS